MKLEAIHTQLYMTQSDMISRQRGRAQWFGHEVQPCCLKFWAGTILFAALLLVIIGPALIFSTLNPALSTNPVWGVALDLELRGGASGTFPLFSSSHYESLADAYNSTSGPSYFPALQQNATAPGQASPIPDDWKALTQQMIMYPFPITTWDLAPPALANLLQLLIIAANATAAGGSTGGGGGSSDSSSNSVWMDLHVSFTRSAPAGNEIITSSSSVQLPPDTCAALAENIASGLVLPSSLSSSSSIFSAVNAGGLGSGGSGGSGSAATATWSWAAPGASMTSAAAEPAVAPLHQVLGSPVTVSNVYPLALHLPATGLPTPLGGAMRDIALTLHRINPNATSSASGGLAAGKLGAQPFSTLPLWWTLNLAAEDPFVGPVGNSSTGGGLVFNLISDKVAPSILTSALGSGYSVLALYAGIVLTVGRLIRSAFGFDPSRVAVEEMPDCSELLELCDGIRTAQRGTYAGAHVDEMTLYRLLIRIMRSSEFLVRIAAPKTEW